ncbi:MAG: anthranilate phosphoribosyltransferase [Acidimicrobiales bacterium]
MATLEELGGWVAVLAALTAGRDLSAAQAGAAMADVFAGGASPAQIAAFIVALRMKGETLEEMTGLAQAMLEVAEAVPLDADLRARLVDTCGTGGDRSGTINVSTIAAFVVAGAGVPVAKHGNRAASSRAGSADVLEALGVRIDLGPEGVARCLAEAGIGFCFAPRFHPAMRHAGPVRRELGVTTVFNFLGPLANPTRPPFQVVGVSDGRMADRMAGVLAANGAVRALVVHGSDGLDELTTTGPSTVVWQEGGQAHTLRVDPAALGLAPATREQLAGGDAAANAVSLRAVLDGGRGAHRDIAVLNAGAGLVAAGAAASFEEGVAQAQRSIDDGAASSALDRLIATSTSAA